MKIDNRLLIPVVLPFLIVAVSRAVYWFSGVPVGGLLAEMIGTIALIFGLPIGSVVSLALFIHGISLGHIRIGRPPQ